MRQSFMWFFVFVVLGATTVTAYTIYDRNRVSYSPYAGSATAPSSPQQKTDNPVLVVNLVVWSIVLVALFLEYGLPMIRRSLDRRRAARALKAEETSARTAYIDALMRHSDLFGPKRTHVIEESDIWKTWVRDAIDDNARDALVRTSFAALKPLRRAYREKGTRISMPLAARHEIASKLAHAIVDAMPKDLKDVVHKADAEQDEDAVDTYVDRVADALISTHDELLNADELKSLRLQIKLQVLLLLNPKSEKTPWTMERQSALLREAEMVTAESETGSEASSSQRSVVVP